MTSHTIFIVLNLLVSLASAAASILAVLKPAALSGSAQVSSGEQFYANMYAARSVPIGALAGLLPFFVRGQAVAMLLVAAAMIQLLDVFIAVREKRPGMVVGASVGTAVHLISAAVLR